MGWGDEIMVTGEARRLRKRDPRPVAVRGKRAGVRWHPIWDGNPRLATPDDVAAGRDVQWLDNGPGLRPYVDYPRCTPERWAYTDWRCTPGEVFVPRLTRQDYVVIEPLIKAKASPNKRWGWERWQALVRLLPELDWVQLGPLGTRLLAGVRHVVTTDFVAACTALSGASAAVLPEGGLHHAAAALGVPAVTIFGGMTSPANTGYDGHINLFVDDGRSPCGMRVECGHCAAAMASITPELVAEHLEELLHGTSRATA